MVSQGKGSSQHFPTNLHALLDEAEKLKHEHIVSWTSQGQSFRIHDSEALVPLLARYFRQTKFKSFLRQLQSYGFHRTTRGCDKGLVSHPLFVRGRRSLARRMMRKQSGHGVALHSHVEKPKLSHSANAIRQMTLPSDGIQPLRKTVSAPAVPQHNSLFRSAGVMPSVFNDFSQLKNEKFATVNRTPQLLPEFKAITSSGLYPQHQVIHNGNNHRKFLPPCLPKRRCASASVLYSNGPDSMVPNKQKTMVRRSSDPVVMSQAQRESIIQCSERASPENSFLLTIKESSTMVPKQVSSSQVHFQVHQGQQQQHHPQMMSQQVLPSQEQQQAQHHQVHVQYEPIKLAQYSPQYYTQVPQQLMPQKVYSHNELSGQIAKAKQDLAKNLLRQQQLQQQQQKPPQNAQHYSQHPRSDACASPVSSDPSSLNVSPIKLADSNNDRDSNNFELSVIASEYIHQVNKYAGESYRKGGTTTATSVVNSGTGSSISVAIASAPPSFGSTDSHRSSLRPITTVLHRESSKEYKDSILEEGTVDYLLRNGSGGCDEWDDLLAEELAEGLSHLMDASTHSAAADPCTSNFDVDSAMNSKNQLKYQLNPIPLNFQTSQ